MPLYSLPCVVVLHPTFGAGVGPVGSAVVGVGTVDGVVAVMENKKKIFH